MKPTHALRKVGVFSRGYVWRPFTIRKWQTALLTLSYSSVAQRLKRAALYEAFQLHGHAECGNLISLDILLSLRETATSCSPTKKLYKRTCTWEGCWPFTNQKGQINVDSVLQCHWLYNNIRINGFFTPRAHAQQGVKWSSLSGQTWVLRWRELATSRTSEHIRSFENTSIIPTCTCYWADSLPLAEISAVFLLSDPLCQPFYLRPWVTPTTYTPRVYLFMPTPSN